MFTGLDIWNKNIGIIGFGKIGQRVAKRALGFDMKVIVYDPYVDKKEINRVGKKVSFENLLTTSDFITLHLPATKDTMQLISHQEFAMMKDGACVINAAYPGIVDEQALEEAMEEGKLAGAALDVPEGKVGELVFNPQKPLYRDQRIIVTPFIGAKTEECFVRQIQTVVQDVISVLEGVRPTQEGTVLDCMI